MPPGVFTTLAFVSCLLFGVDARRVARNESKIFYNSVLAWTRFNCAFPFCPTTALDVCTMDEHYEVGRPHVIATLIPQTDTADMAFFAYSAFDNATRLHYTLAPRVVAGAPFTQLFTVFIELNGTSGHQVGEGVEVALPGAAADITYFFTHQGAAYVTFSGGVMYALNPSTGAVGNATHLLPAGSQLVDTRASVFDEKTGTLFTNSKGVAPSGASGYFLHSFNVGTGVAGAVVGPLGPTPTTDSNPGGLRADDAVATLAVYPPASVDPTQALRLMEMRTSPLFPWIFMAWLNPVTGNSTEIPLPDEWYQNWDIDPEVYPEQWPGSQRRVWAYDPITQQAIFKLYDECGGADDCSEDETVATLQWVPPEYVDWFVCVCGARARCPFTPLPAPLAPTRLKQTAAPLSIPFLPRAHPPST